MIEDPILLAAFALLPPYIPINPSFLITLTAQSNGFL